MDTAVVQLADARPPQLLERIIPGDSEMSRRMRALEWSKTPLGPAEHWPQSLRGPVSHLLASKAQIILFWGPEFVSLYNDAYIPVFGAKHPQMLGQPGQVAWSELWDTGVNLHALLDGVVATGEAFSARDLLFVVERNGFVEDTYFDVSYDPVRGESGEVAGVFCIVTETTGRVVGERRLAVLHDLAARNANARNTRDACALAMASLAARPDDVPFALAYFGDELQAATPGAEAALATAAPDRVRELPIPGGRLMVGVNPRRPYDDQYAAFLALVAGQIATAVANARAYEEERKRAEALAELDRAKTVFFSNVSHEFRTPLTLLLGPLEDTLTQANGPLPAEATAALAVAHRNSLRLLRLVNTLLDFSRLQADRIEACYERTDLAGFTAELAGVFRTAIEKAGLRFVVDCPPLAGEAFVDREMWEKIVFNLLSNAFKFTFDGEIAVRLRENDGQITLTVSDTGVGIPQHELPRLFERFHRIRQPRARTHEGTGIGLALVQELAHLHGGEVSAKSGSAHGSVFEVRIPTGKAHLPPERIEASRQLSSTATGGAPFLLEALRWLPDGIGQDADSPLPALADLPVQAQPYPAPADRLRPRVLVADDNADIRDYIYRLLGKHYQVECVPDGKAALERVAAAPPDLVLADVMMPHVDGFGLLRALRGDERMRSIPVILLSARAGEESRVEGLQAGADDYLVKPFGAREMLARVASHLQLAQLRRESGEKLDARVKELEAANLHLDKAAERLRLLWDAAAIMLSTDNADWMVRSLFAKVSEHLGTDAYFNFLVSPAGDCLQLVSCAGVSDKTTRSIQRIELGQAISGTVALQRRPIVATHIQSSDDPKVQLVKSFGIRSYACNPLIAENRLIGTLSFASRTRDSFEPDEIAFLETLCQYITMAYERLRLLERLREADRRKDEFIAMLAHELRNPLFPVRNALQLLRLADGKHDVIEAARGVMERQVSQMVRLVDDLLDVARITRGKLELKRERVELALLVKHAVEDGRPLIEQMAHTLEIHLPSESVYLDADAVRLTQVFLNLLNNAAKYTEPGGHITLTATREEGEVAVAVRDTGIGIPADKLPSVFDIFTQVEPPADRSQGGLGLGLTLVKHLAELHGGSVEASSYGAGRGSTFTVRLPVAHGAAGAVAAAASQAVASLPGHRILIVDDNRDGANSLAMVLRMLGNHVHITYDGIAAIIAAEAFRPNLVLLDIGLPRMDGHEVCRRIREQPWGKDMVLVAVTGWGQEEDRRRSLESGFDHHLVKPVNPADLEKLLSEDPRLQPRPRTTDPLRGISEINRSSIFDNRNA